MKEWLCTNREQ